VPGDLDVNVFTWQNDTFRTGQNLNETVLTPTAIKNSNFGQLCSVQLDGQVYAQPLIVTDVTISKIRYTTPGVVYVVTQNDTLYAIDAANCGILNGNGSGTNLLNGGYPVNCMYIGQPTSCTDTIGLSRPLTTGTRGCSTSSD
jgi:PQQ-like domain